MIYVMGSGNVAFYKYGFWRINFPAGSSCQITNGTKVLSAPADAVSAGRYTFPISVTGTWTATCTDGTHTATATQAFSSVYSYATKTLAYSVDLFNETLNTSLGSIVQASGNSGFLKVSNKILKFGIEGTTQSDYEVAFTFANTFNFSGYSSLKFQTNTNVQTGQSIEIGIGTSKTNMSLSLKQSGLTNNTSKLYTLNLASYQGSYYLKFCYHAEAYGQYITADFTRIWVE